MSEPREVNGEVTLAEVFGKDFTTAFKKQIGQAVKGRGDASLKWTRKVLWWLVSSKVNAQVDELLEQPMGSTWGEAYARLGQVRALGHDMRDNRRKYRAATPDKPYQFRLKVKHTITIKPKHSIRVEFGNEKIGELQVDVELRLIFQKPTLGVAEGRLYSASPGVCTVKGSVTCQVDDSKPLTLPLPPPPFEKLELKLGGPIPFDPPVQILPSKLETREAEASPLKVATSTATSPPGTTSRQPPSTPARGDIPRPQESPPPPRGGPSRPPEPSGPPTGQPTPPRRSSTPPPPPDPPSHGTGADVYWGPEV